MKARLTAGGRALRDLARRVESMTARLRNKARLVGGDPTPGRNLTALKTTAREMTGLLRDLLKQRCRVCGCTDDDCTGCVKRTGAPCRWVAAELCSACREPPCPK